MSGPPGISYDQWTSLLAEHFFRPEYAGVHVMFFVDDACLAELANRDADAAARSLAEGVVSTLDRRRPEHLFAPFVRRTRRWKESGGDGPPPGLPMLAAAVLAATRMRRTGATAAHNYYVWLLGLLRDAGLYATEQVILDGYAETMPVLWRSLEWWLDERHHGALGRSTIVEHRRWHYIGYADSQTLFTSSDREKLSQFFGWIGLRPRERIDERELLQMFRLWASRRDDLNLGTQAMLEDAAYPAQLVALLRQAAASWEGVVRDDEGRKEALIAITLHPAPPVRLGLAAPRPPGFPATLEVSPAPGRLLTLSVDDEGFESNEQQWYDGLLLEPSASILESGLRLVSGEHVLRLPPREYHILHKSRELGCWASESNLQPGETAWLLVRLRALPEVTSFLDEHARAGWVPLKREGVAPPRWQLIRGVIVDRAPNNVSGTLARLAPRTSNRATLSGGLPLPRGTDVYLSGGEPDVVLPPREDFDPLPVVTVDGAEVPVRVAASAVRLKDLELREGTHRLVVDSAPRTISTVETLGVVAPHVELMVAHALRRQGDELRPTSLGARHGTEASSGELIIAGAAVLGDDSPVRRDRPLVLPIGASRIALLGARPGELETPPIPAEPRWMVDARLEYRVFEHVAAFDVVWLITNSRFRGVRVRLVAALEPGRSCDRGDVAAWSRELLECGADPNGEVAQGLWQRYRTLAGELARG